MTTKLAKEVNNVILPRKAAGYWRLFHVDPPMKDDEGNSYSHVIVSAATVLGEPETYIFPAAVVGGEGGPKTVTVANWGELNGSYTGGLSHFKALENAGYTVV